MSMKLYNELSKYGQCHLLNFWKQLSKLDKHQLSKQLSEINWREIDKLIKESILKKPEINIPDDLHPASFYPLIPSNNECRELYKKAIAKGKEMFFEQKVGVFTVAGGQGTRLGFDGPKGTYPITLIKGKTLFQCFAEKIKRASVKYSTLMPWYIMTSDMNYNDILTFFEANDYFGLKKDNVIFFRQGMMPAIGRDGKVLLDTKSSLALSPNGHGGSLLGLRKSGALNDMAKREIEYIFYFQVDNPLVPIADPLFIGLHAITSSEMSSMMIPKNTPFEKLGNFCISGGKTMIIEYSDLPKALAEKRNRDGSLAFIAGSPAIHIISRSLVERLTENGVTSLPWHRADKKVAYIDESGSRVEPLKENAVKLETFIFDALPMVKKSMILEGNRAKQFAPVKNKTGIDSVESCREIMLERDADWIERFAGVKIPRKADGKPDCLIELSHAAFLDEEDVSANKIRLSKIRVERGSSVYIE